MTSIPGAGKLAAAFASVLMVALLMVGRPLPAASAHSVTTETDQTELPTVISGGSDHNIKRWAPSGKLIDTLGSLEDSVNVLLLLPNGLLASGGADGLVKFWNLTNATETRSITASKSAVDSLAATPDGSLLAVGTADGKIALWSYTTGKRLSETPAHGGAVQALQIASDGMLLISGSADKTIRIWHISREMGRIEYKSNISAHDEPVTAIAISRGDGLIATVSEDGYLKTWRLDGGLVGRMKVCDRGVESVAFSPDGRIVATGDSDGKVRLWNAQTSTPLTTVLSHSRDRAVLALAFSPDGKVLVSGGADKTIRYWNVESGQKLKSIAAHDGEIRSLVISP